MVEGISRILRHSVRCIPGIGVRERSAADATRDGTELRRRGLAVALCAALVACGESDPGAPAGVAPPAGPLSVFTVNYPLSFFAERIGGEGVAVTFPAPRDVDPAYWSPAPEIVAAYQRADVILLNGAGYARWVERASLPRARRVDTSAAIRDRIIPLEGDVAHSHGPQGAHSHRGFAFTTWLDPTLAIEQARAVMRAFRAARPERGVAFQAGFDALEVDLLALGASLDAAAAPVGKQPLLFSHPLYQYLARRNGWDARSLHWEPDEAPTGAMWRELEELLAVHRARWMLWEGPPLESTAKRLASLGVGVVVYGPCANAPDRGDFLSVMRENLQALEAYGEIDGTAPT